jgi:hypothetical protein
MNDIKETIERGFDKLLKSRRKPYYTSLGVAIVTLALSGTSVLLSTNDIPQDEVWEIIGGRALVTFDQSATASLNWGILDQSKQTVLSTKPVTNSTNDQVTAMQLVIGADGQSTWTPVSDTSSPTVGVQDALPSLELTNQTSMAVGIIGSAAFTLGYCELIVKKRRRVSIPPDGMYA